MARITVYNKCDLCDDETLPAPTEGAICVSAATGRNLDRLMDMIREAVCRSTVAFDWSVPYDRGGVIAQLYDNARVDSVDYTDTCIRVQGRCDSRLFGQLQKMLGVRQ